MMFALLLFGFGLWEAQVTQDSPNRPPATQTSSATDTRGQDQSAQQPRKIYHVGGDVKPPRFVSGSQPTPAGTKKESASKKVAEEGSAILLVVIGEDGSVRSAKVYKSLNPDLDAKAMDAARWWKFQPATKKGIPVAVEVAISVEFHLYK